MGVLKSGDFPTGPRGITPRKRTKGPFPHPREEDDERAPKHSSKFCTY